MGLAVDAASFLVSAATVAAIGVEAPRAPRVGMVAELREGWREVTDRSWLPAGLVAATAYHAAFGAVVVLIDVIAVRDLGGPTALGWISAASGAGGLIGGLLALRLPPTRPLLVGWPCVALMSLFAAAFAWPGDLAVIIAAAVVAFGGLMYFSVCWDTALQDRIPHTVLARVASWHILTSFVAIPAGNALAGPLAHTFGTSRVIAVAAVVMALAALAPMFVRSSRELRRSVPGPATQPAGQSEIPAASHRGHTKCAATGGLEPPAGPQHRAPS